MSFVLVLVSLAMPAAAAGPLDDASDDAWAEYREQRRPAWDVVYGPDADPAWDAAYGSPAGPNLRAAFAAERNVESMFFQGPYAAAIRDGDAALADPAAAPDLLYDQARAAIGDPGDQPTATGRLQAALGAGFSCFLLEDGTVPCDVYGTTWSGEDLEIDGDDTGGVVDIVAQSESICLLRADGDIECQGSSDAWTYSGGDAVQVDRPRCYTTADGNARCAGDTYTGGDAVKAAGDSGTSCFLLEDGGASCRWHCFGSCAPVTYYNVTSGVADLAVVAGEVCLLRTDASVSCHEFWEGADRDVVPSGAHALAVGGEGLGFCVLMTGAADHCEGSRGWEECIEFCTDVPIPANPYPSLEVAAFAFALEDACWIYDDGTSYCERENQSFPRQRPPGLPDDLPALPVP